MRVYFDIIANGQIYWDKSGTESASLKTVFLEVGEAIAELATDGEFESLEEGYLVVSTAQRGVVLVFGVGCR